MFSAKDLEQINARGATPALIENQIENFKKGFPFINLVDIATVNKGVISISTDEAKELMMFYDANLTGRELLKFVPASGAASRMFKDLLSFLHEDKEPKKEVVSFCENIKSYACFEDLKQILAANTINIDELLIKKDYKTIIDYLLSAKGLNYAALPKGLLKFHKYTDYIRTGIEEHLVEGAIYACSNNNIVKLHFTVSPEHKPLFQTLIDSVKSKYEIQYGVKYEITYSIQEPSTDTIAVDMENNPFREKDGSLVFRPGGHGALIENLNHINGEIIFIKNIDNVVPDRLKNDTFIYKKVIGGLLLKVQKQIHTYLTELDNIGIEESKLNEIATDMNKQFQIYLPDGFNELSSELKQKVLISLLNKPIRICGVVKNEGEPGGGPFLVKNSKGVISLQIVESAQIDLNNLAQKLIFDKSSHFNPVDLVCAVRDYKGNQFNLKDFIDVETGFISYKSKDGKDLKAMELPGLWNGAMANWITLFVEVPISTFNPVKTIFDLARDNHKA